MLTITRAVCRDLISTGCGLPPEERVSVSRCTVGVCLCWACLSVFPYGFELARAFVCDCYYGADGIRNVLRFRGSVCKR